MRMGRLREAVARHARRFDRCLWVHAEVDEVDGQLDHRLWLHIVAGRAIRCEDLAIAHDQAGIWGEAWPLAGGDRARVVRIQPRLHAATGDDEAETRHD